MACINSSPVCRCIKTLSTQTAVACIDLHRNGSTLAVGMVDGCVQLFDLRSKTDDSFYSFHAHDSSLYGLKFVGVNPNATQNISSNMSARFNKTARPEDQTTNPLFKRSNSMGFDQTLNETQTKTNATFTTASNVNLDKTAVPAHSESFEIYSPDVPIPPRHKNPESTQMNITMNDNNGYSQQLQANQKQQINSLTPILNDSTTPTTIKNSTVMQRPADASLLKRKNGASITVLSELSGSLTLLSF
jgi:hypothetical protein